MKARSVKTKVLPPAERYAAQRELLLERRRQLEGKIRDSLSASRAERPTQRHADGVDEAEASDAEVQDEIAFSLIEAHADAIERIDEAVRRLDNGRYGLCGQCGDEIAESRLRALPFATRCVECERQRELGHGDVAIGLPRVRARVDDFQGRMR